MNTDEDGGVVTNKFHPLSSTELVDMLENISGFRDVFPHDMIPKKVLDKDYSIINLGSWSSGGTHWVCYVNHPNLSFITYYDSYGLPPSDKIRELLRTSNKPIRFNTSQIQQNNSIMCGYYCAHLIKEIDKNPSISNLYDILYSFEQMPSDFNEKLIRSLF